jgi:hypothetical protein
VAHYTIGFVFAVVFVVLASGDWLAPSRTPYPTQARLKSLATHTVFGLGLYGCALGVSCMLRMQA